MWSLYLFRRHHRVYNRLQEGNLFYYLTDCSPPPTWTEQFITCAKPHADQGCVVDTVHTECEAQPIFHVLVTTLSRSYKCQICQAAHGPENELTSRYSYQVPVPNSSIALTGRYQSLSSWYYKWQTLKKIPGCLVSKNAVNSFWISC